MHFKSLLSSIDVVAGYRKELSFKGANKVIRLVYLHSVNGEGTSKADKRFIRF